jgi:hypothetical protein
VNDASPSEIPDSHASSKEGNTVLSITDIFSMLFFNNFSLIAERNIKNLAFIVGNTILPLNKLQIIIKFLISWTINV